MTMLGLRCPNPVDCGHWLHDIEEMGDPRPTCVEEDCTCGKTEKDKQVCEEYFNDETNA